MRVQLKHFDCAFTIQCLILSCLRLSLGPIPASLLADNDGLQHQLMDTGLFTVDHLGNGTLTVNLDLPLLDQAVNTKDVEFLDFLRALLQIDPAFRFSAKEALTHPWLQHGVFFAENCL